MEKYKSNSIVWSTMELPTFETIDFLNKFVRIRKALAKPLKEEFVKSFCDIESNRYHRYLTGRRYQAWTAMHYDWKLVSKEDLVNSPPFKGDVYVGWDYKDYYVEMYSLGKYYLFQMPFSKFLDHYLSFPENTYVFDSELKYALVSTPMEFYEYTQNMRLYKNQNQ